jgi:hypothetical protein
VVLVLSVPEHSQLAAARSSAVIELRQSDWGLSGWQRAVFLTRRGWEAARRNRADVLVLATAGIEALTIPTVPGKGQIAVWDPLVPKHTALRLLARVSLPRLDLIAVIRRGDADTLAALGVSRERLVFAPFPITTPIAQAGEDDGYVYAAGSAYRDWATFVSAMRLAGCAGIIATSDLVPAPANVKVLPAQSPADGRKIMERAAIVVAPILETTLPAGPLVILDALAMGKPVVATDVNGTRDYVQNGVTGILVPPNDPHAMAGAVSSLLANGTQRAAMSEAAINFAGSLTLDKALGIISAAIGANER